MKANATGFVAYPGGPNRAARFKALARIKGQDGYGWRQRKQRAGEKRGRQAQAV